MVETWQVWIWTEHPWEQDKITQVTVCKTPLKAAHIPHQFQPLMVLDTGAVIGENEAYETFVAAQLHAIATLHERQAELERRITRLQNAVQS